MPANIQQPLCSWMRKPPTWCEYGAPTPEGTLCHRVTYPEGSFTSAVTLMEVSLDVPQGLTEQRVIRR